MTAPQNRSQRRAQKQTGRNQIPVEQYRVPQARVALSVDFEGSDPYTIEIEAGSLADVVSETGKFMTGWSYQRVLNALAAVHHSHVAGDPAAVSGLLVGFWLALHHPIGGESMRRLLSERIAAGDPCHITMRCGRTGGIGFALAERFVDLDDAAALVKAAGVGVIRLEAQDGEQRAGGVQ